MDEIKKRWILKRASIYNLQQKINTIKRHVKIDLFSCKEKDQLTALVIRIMMHTSERVGNKDSAENGHFGVTQFKPKHITVIKNKIILSYTGKSGVDHQKEFVDEPAATLLKRLKSRNQEYLFTTSTGFRISPDRINRYLKKYGAKSKDIRGYNANRMMVLELNRIGKTDVKQRPKVFNDALRKIGEKVGHGPATLRTHYLLPEIEKNFYDHGSVGRIKID